VDEVLGGLVDEVVLEEVLDAVLPPAALGGVGLFLELDHHELNLGDLVRVLLQELLGEELGRERVGKVLG
jgi:hypothetical protein